MRRAARAIVVHDNKLLVMHRQKFGQDYYTLIGGGVEMGESLEQALVREIAEETGLTIKSARLVFTEPAGAPYGTQYIFLCESDGGEPQLAPDTIEAKINQLGQNLYQPVWIPLAQLPVVNFRSERLKDTLVNALKTGFPKESVTI